MQTYNDLPTPTQEERTTAMLAHLLMIFTGFIGPLVLYFVKRESRFIAFHSVQALIYQCFAFLFSMALIVGSFVIFVVMMAVGNKAEHPSGPPAGFFIFFGSFWIVWMGFWVLTLVLGIIYTIKASNGEWAGYPVVGTWARRIVLRRSVTPS